MMERPRTIESCWPGHAMPPLLDLPLFRFVHLANSVIFFSLFFPDCPSRPIGIGNLVALVGAMLISVQTPEGTIALTQQMPACELLR